LSKPKTDLALQIRKKTLELLMVREPEEISTRDIAKACGVTATSLYYYYKDKEVLFNELKLDCIAKMDEFIVKKVIKHGGSNKKSDPLPEMRAGLKAFRDWAFANPRIALLVMGRLKADTQAEPEKMKKYYSSTDFAKTTLDKAIKAGLLCSKNTLMDANLSIAALWGAIELVLLNRTVPKYWSQRGGIEFTNKMIDLLITSLTNKNRQK